MNTQSGILESTPVQLAIQAFLVALFTILMSVYLRASVPSTDSAVFAYCGQQLMTGLAPYEGCWDHKPPAIHYLNALGLWLSDGRLWGLWIVQWVFGLFAVMACYRLLLRVFGAGVAWLATALCIVELMGVLEGGNLTEQYALTFQFGALWSFQRYGYAASKGIRWLFLAGILGGCALLLRQNLIALWLAFGLVSVGRHVGAGRFLLFLKEMGFMAAGVGFVLTSAAVALWSLGAMQDTWTAAFAYNFANTSPGLYARLNALAVGLNTLWLASIAVAGWLVAAYSVIVRPEDLGSEGRRLILAVSLVAFPLEMLFSIISGRDFFHYFMAWLPAMTVLVGFALQSVYLGWISGHEPSVETTRRRLAWGTGFVIWGALLVQNFPTLYKAWWAPELSRERAVWEVQGILDDLGAKGDRLLVWGNNVAFNLLSGYSSPTRFVYQYPIFLGNPGASELAAEFNDRVLRAPPQWIIDTAKNVSMPRLGADACRTWYGTSSYEVCSALDSFYELAETRYRLIQTVGTWRIYRLNASTEHNISSSH